MEYLPLRISDIVRVVNRDYFLPAIQRELVWKPNKIERLFDSIMGDYPIGALLFWRLANENKDSWPIYKFVQNFNDEKPHNEEAEMRGVDKDLHLVLDGQQRISALYIGLKGTYRYHYYRWKKTRLYLNLLKTPIADEENPEALTYEFAFRESDAPKDATKELWFLVGSILDHDDAEDAKTAFKSRLTALSEEQRDAANKMLGRLHSRVHSKYVTSYYEERSQDYDKVLQIFVRANSAGTPLEYSDLLLATATAKWEDLDARKEIHEFTDELNRTGEGYTFGKDFVLKAALYLTEPLPIQYKVKNFTRANLTHIEKNWERVKNALKTTVRLIATFGYTDQSVVAELALLPIAYWIAKRGDWDFESSSDADAALQQAAIQRWFAIVTLKNAFGGSSDTTLTRLRLILRKTGAGDAFPADAFYRELEIEPRFSDAEIEHVLGYQYRQRYTHLVLSLLYPDRDWKASVVHQDHIFPASEFSDRLLKKRGYDARRIERYQSRYNTLVNLELLTKKENLAKNAEPFDTWITTRDAAFKKRHSIPELPSYAFDAFDDFYDARRALIVAALKSL